MVGDRMLEGFRFDIKYFSLEVIQGIFIFNLLVRVSYVVLNNCNGVGSRIFLYVQRRKELDTCEY